jgi:thioredoxin-related protein
MKVTLPILLLLFSVMAQAEQQPAPTPMMDSSLTHPGYQEKPDWFKESFLDLRDDVKEATAANKRVMLYFYQDGCPYCAKLLKDNFGKQEIADKTRKNFDVIAINMWGDRSVTDVEGKEATEKTFAAALKVQYTPTLLFLDETGKVALRLNGYYAPDKFEVALDFVAGKHDKEGSFRDYYAKLKPAGKSAVVAKPNVIADSLPQPLKLKDDRKGSGRPLLVIFGQAECDACNEFYKDILTRPEVGYSSLSK